VYAQVLQLVSIRQHTSAHVSIRQHTSAYASIRQQTDSNVHYVYAQVLQPLYKGRTVSGDYIALPQLPEVIAAPHVHLHTSAYGSMRQHTAAYVNIPGHSIRQHTSAYVSIRKHTWPQMHCSTPASYSIFSTPAPSILLFIRLNVGTCSIRQHASAHVSIRQHTSTCVSRRQQPHLYS
jgi:hypothetical protein